MYRQFIVSVIINCVVANDQNLPQYGSENKAMVSGDNLGVKASTKYNHWHQHFWKPKGGPYNITFIDKAENMIRLPTMGKYLGEKKAKQKSVLKKSPKRTIQKIIKKNSKTKIRKIYIKMTSYPTAVTKAEFEKEVEFSPRKEETTTQTSQKKRLKKYKSKQLPRYPVPFHLMQTKKNYKRNKRNAARNLFIFKDLDQIEFLKEKKDYNVVNAHVKKYW